MFGVGPRANLVYSLDGIQVIISQQSFKLRAPATSGEEVRHMLKGLFGSRGLLPQKICFRERFSESSSCHLILVLSVPRGEFHSTRPEIWGSSRSMGEGFIPRDQRCGRFLVDDGREWVVLW